MSIPINMLIFATVFNNHLTHYTMKTKKFFLAALAVTGTMALTTVFSACTSETTHTTSYNYTVECVSSILYYDYDEYRTVQAAFDRAVGDVGGGTVNPVYHSPQDESMKRKCEEVKSQYSNIKSIYMKFELKRITSSTEPGTPDIETVIATYELGQSTVKTCMEYAFVSTEDDAYTALLAKEGTLDPKVFEASLNTLLKLVGIHSTYVGLGSLVSSSRNSVFEQHFRDEFNKIWEDSEDYDRYVVYACDSIANAHAADTLAVDVTVGATKTEFLSRKVTTIWAKTFHANF